MLWIGQTLTVLAVSMDAFWCGFALGGRQVRLRARSALYIGAWPLALSLVAAVAGHGARQFIPAGWVRMIGGCVLLVIAVMAFREALRQWRGGCDRLACGRDASLGESTLVSVAVAIDASMAAFALSLAGLPPVISAVAMAAAHGALVLVGNRLGLFSIGKMRGWYVFLPCAILLGMSVLRFAG